MTPQLLLFFLIFAVFFGCLVLAMPSATRGGRAAERMLQVVRTDREDHRTVPLKERLLTTIVTTSTRVRKQLGMAENAKLRKRLQQAGLRGESAAHTFFASQALAVVLGGIGGSFITENTFFWVFAGVLVGYIAPDMWLSKRIAKRKDRMRRSVPDAVDLLVICVDAGLGMDQALRRVRDDLSLSHPALNEEFDRLNLELMAGTPRAEAWKRLADRTKLSELASLAAILAETDRFGTPISKALAGFSEDLRVKRRQHAEEAAAKTKIKIIFPLVLCIFPCIFIVLLAPALLSIAQGMGGVGQ